MKSKNSALNVFLRSDIGGKMHIDGETDGSFDGNNS